jgi:hypothetical protein
VTHARKTEESTPQGGQWTGQPPVGKKCPSPTAPSCGQSRSLFMSSEVRLPRRGHIRALRLPLVCCVYLLGVRFPLRGRQRAARAPLGGQLNCFSSPGLTVALGELGRTGCLACGFL